MQPPNQTAPQATLGGSLTVNGGVFAYGNGAGDVTGGSFTRLAGAEASFFAMGGNTSKGVNRNGA